MKGLSIEARVGLLILVALMLLAAFVFVLGGMSFDKGYPVYVDFNNPGNIQPGAPVNVGSIRVGKVEEVEYRGGRLDPQTGRRPMIRLKLDLKEDIADTVHEDALFYVTATSVLGESIIAIDPGSPESPQLKSGAIVEGVDPPRLDLAFGLAYEILESLASFVRNHKDEIGDALAAVGNLVKSLEGMLTKHGDRIGRIIENVEVATTQLNELVSSANGVVSGPRLKRIVRNLDSTLGTVARDVDPILTDVRSATAKVDTVLDVVGPEEQKQLRDTLKNASLLAQKANSTLTDARKIVKHIGQGKGTVGALLMDEEIYDDVQELLRDLKHNPWKLFWRE